MGWCFNNLVGAIAVIVLPKFTNMQSVNHMGPSFSAGSSLHSVSFTAGAIGSISAGVLALGLFGVGGYLIYKGRKEAKERTEEEQHLIAEKPTTAKNIGLISEYSPIHSPAGSASNLFRPL